MASFIHFHTCFSSGGFFGQQPWKDLKYLQLSAISDNFAGSAPQGTSEARDVIMPPDRWLIPESFAHGAASSTSLANLSCDILDTWLNHN